MSYDRSLPVGWTIATLGQVLTVIRGVSYKKEQAAFTPSGNMVPILRATNINQGLQLNELVYVPKSCVLQYQYLRVGDIVIAASSGSQNVVGKAAQLTCEWEGSFGAFCMGLRPSHLMDAQYVAFFLKTTEYRHGISLLAAGSNINNLRRDDIESFPLPVAPLKEQRRIVLEVQRLFTYLDSGIAGLKRVEMNLKRYRTAVLKSAVDGTLTKEWRSKNSPSEPAERLLERLLIERRKKWEEEQLARFAEREQTPPRGWKDKYVEPQIPDVTNLPALPDGWCWASVEQVGAPGEQAVLTGPFGTTLGKPDFIDVGVPLLTIGCLTESGLSLRKAFYISENKARSLDRYRIREGDILFSRMASIGRAGYVTGEFSGAVINYHLMRLRLASSGLIPLYFVFYVQGSNVVADYLRAVNHGVTRDGINTRELLNMPVAMPPLDEQRVILRGIEGYFSILSDTHGQIDAGIRRAARLRQAILKYAFDGYLVSQDPNEEPASNLLEQIRKQRKTESTVKVGKRSRIAGDQP